MAKGWKKQTINKVWTAEEVRDGLVRRGYCVFVQREGEDWVIAARKSEDNGACVVRIRDGRIILPNLGD